jgi:triacylglycerol lipase
MQRRPSSTINPVLLVHGIDASGRRFKAMRTGLLRYGFKPVIAMDIIPSNGSIPIEAMAEQVRDAARHLLTSTGADRIDCVGFSMGALATRYFLQKLGGRTIIRRFISISGPHHGSYNALFRPNTACRQMRPGSPLLQNLNSETDPFDEVDVYSFYTPFDLMVIPSRSSILPHAHNRPFNVWLHPLMITNRRVIEAVVHTLADMPISS